MSSNIELIAPMSRKTAYDACQISTWASDGPQQLRTFRAVAELGSLSKAADRLRAAQPALSRHIKLLEHELRVELFVATAAACCSPARGGCCSTAPPG
jgi:hypothetical protein